MVRVHRWINVLAILVIALSGCQTTGSERSSSVVTGVVSGAASGAGVETGRRLASGGHTGSPLLGLVVGAVVGAAAGYFVSAGNGAASRPLTAAERALADDAVVKAAEIPIGERIDWQSPTDENVFGWAAPHSDVKVIEGRECRELGWRYFTNPGDVFETVRLCREGGQWVRL